MAGNVNIGGVRMTYSARTEQFRSGSEKVIGQFRRQEQAARSLQRNVRTLRNAFSGLVGALGLTAGVAGLGLLARRIEGAAREQTKYGATLRELSFATGATVRDLQLMIRVFEADGATVEQVQKALVRLNRTASEARDLETYGRQFRRLGVDLEEWRRSGESVIGLLYRLADGFAAMENPADRVSAAMNLLGRGAGSLVVPLQRGSESLREQAEAFAELGVNTELELTRLKALEQSYTDRANAIQVALATIVAENVEVFDSFNKWIVEFGPQAFKGIIDAINFLKNNLEAVRQLAVFIIVYALGRTAVGQAIVGLLELVDVSRRLEIRLIGARAAAIALGRALILPALAVGLLEAIEYVRRLKREVDGIDEISVPRIGLNESEQAIHDQFDEQRKLIEENVAAQIEAAHQVAEQRARLDLTNAEMGFAHIEAQRDAEIKAIREAAAVRIGELETARAAAIRADRENAYIDNFTAATSQGNDVLADRVDIYQRLRRGIDDQSLALFRENQLLGLNRRERAIEIAQSQALFEYGAESLKISRRIEDSKLNIAHLERQYAAAIAAGEGVRSASISQELVKEDLRLQKLQEYAAALHEEQVAVLELRDSYIELASEQQDLLEAQERIERRAAAIANAQQSISDAVGRFAASAVLNIKSVEDALASLLQQILNVLAELLIVQPVAQAIAGAFAGSGAAPAPVPRQTGGFVPRNTPALVGEAGREIVVFGQDAYVHSNARTEKALGGNTFIFAPEVNVSDRQAVDTALAESYPYFKADIIQTVMRDSGRPSALRNAIRR